MRLVHKRIIAAAVSLTVTATGAAAYFGYAGNPFDPNKYSKNTGVNRNQITFNDDSSQSDEKDEFTDVDEQSETEHWQQDGNSEQKMDNESKPDASVLFETPPVEDDEPTIINPDIPSAYQDENDTVGGKNNAYVVDDGKTNNGTDITVPRPAPNNGGSGKNDNGGGNTSNGIPSDRNNNGGTNSNGSNNSGSDNNKTPDNSNNGNNTKPSDPDEPNEPDVPDEPDVPSDPVYDNDYVEKEPEQPGGIYDNMLPTYPMPDDGLDISDDPTEQPKLTVVSLTATYDVDCIYYGETLTPKALLCASNAYVTYGGKMYRISALGPNFRITNFPRKASENFTATFSFRLDQNSPWVSEDVEFEVRPYKLVLSDYNHTDYINPKTTQYPEEGETIDLLNYYGKMYDNSPSYPTETEDSIQNIFMGWSENNGGTPIYYDYTPSKKGLTALYPLGTTKLPEDFKAKITNIWNEHDHYCYVQTLTGYTGSRELMDIPNGLQMVEVTADVDRVNIPASIMSIGSGLSVKYNYNVDGSNQYMTSVDGALYNKELTEVLSVPYSKTSLTVLSSAKKINITENNELRRLTILSDSVPNMDIRKLENAVIYVPDSSYLTYLRKWASKLGTNKILPLSQSTENRYYTKDDAVLMDTAAGTVLCGVTEDVKGIYVVPEGVTEIKSGAFDGCDLDILILPESLQVLNEDSVSCSSGMNIYFSGETVPQVNDNGLKDTDQLAGIHVPVGKEDEYKAVFSDCEDIIKGEEFEVCENDGYKYFMESDGAVLLRVPDDTVNFTADALSDVKIKAVGARAFSGCRDLMTVELPADTEYILTGAFDGCKKLEQIVSMSQFYIYVSDGVFDDCDSLTCVAFNAFSANFEDSYTPSNKNCYFYRPFDSYGYANTFSEFIYSYRMEINDDGVVSVYGEMGEQSLMMSVTSNLSGEFALAPDTIEIAPSAFSNCKNPFTITADSFAAVGYIDVNAFEYSGLAGDIQLGQNVMLIGSEAFRGCKNITSVYFDTSSACKELPSNLFNGCTALENVDFSENVNITTIMTGAFENTALKTFTFPSTVTNVYYGIFNGCPNMEEIIFTGDVPPSLVLFAQGSEFTFTYVNDQKNNVKITMPDEIKADCFENWRYTFFGYPTFDDLCWYYYFDGIWDFAPLEDTAQKVTDMIASNDAKLKELIGLEDYDSPVTYDEVYQKLLEIEGEMSIW